MPLLLADFIHSRRCKPNLRKNVDTTNYRAEHNLLLITLSMQAELFWAGFKLKAWGRLKLADYLDGNTIAEK